MPDNVHSKGGNSPRQRATVAIGDYELGPQIGRGSFATVYKGVNRKTNTLVAIKSVVRSSLTRRLLENLETEINILRTVKHKCIVELIDCLKSRNHIHLVMEYCSLGDLASYMRKRKEYPSLRSEFGGLNMDLVRYFVVQLGAAMRFLRSRDVIHRDIKTQNILLQPPSEDYILGESEERGVFPLIKVADFGFARNLPSTALAETLCGSPLYMAPEILHYEPYDAKADLWSIGAVIYEMLAGKPPFHASNHVELARIIERTNDNIVFPDERKAAADDDKSDSGAAAAFEAPNGIDPVLKDLVRRLLKMKPSNRMSFHEFFAHPALQPQLDSSQPPPQAQTLSGNAAAAAASGSSSGGYDGILQLPENATASARQSLGTPEGGRHMEAGGNAAHATGSGSRPASSNSPRRDAILYHHRQQQQQQTPSTRSHSLDTGESSVLSAQQLPSRDGDNGRRRTVPDTVYHQAQAGHRDDHLSAAMGRLNMDDGQHRYQQQGQRANVYPPPSQQQYRQMQQRRSGDLDSRVSVDAAGHQRKNSLADEDQAMAEREYVVIEKRAVEMNVLADELESSPRTPIAFYPPRAGAIQQAPGVARQMTALARAVHDAVSSQYQISTEAANGPLNSRVAAAASAGLLSSDAGRRTGVSSRSVHGVFNPLDAELAETFESRHSQGSPPEEPTIRRMEGLAYKAFAMSFLADLKWRLLPPSALGGSPSSRRQRQQQQQRAGPTDPLADPDGGFLSPSDVSIEEAFVLYLKALSLLHRAMIVASRYWASMHKTAVPGGEHGGYSISTSAIAMGAGRSSSVSQSSAGTGGSSTVAVVSVAFNSAVQWVRSKFNECLERAEALKQLANGGELDNVAQVSIEQVLYEQALSLSKMAAVRELKWIDPLDCDRAYQLAIWMLSAILEATDTASSASMRMEDGSAGFEDGSSSVDREEMDLEDRTIIEQFIASIVKRRETLQRRLIQQEAAAANV